MDDASKALPSATSDNTKYFQKTEPGVSE